MCGISLMDPSTWFTSAVFMTSPICRGLNMSMQLSIQVMDYVWYHLTALALGHLTLMFPSLVIPKIDGISNIDGISKIDKTV